MRIGLDLDGVLYQFDKTAQYMIAKNMGFEKREELKWDYEKFWRGVPEAQWDWLWRAENLDPLFRHGHLYRGAIEFVYDLAAKGSVMLITKRPAEAERVTWDWLTFHWGEPGKAWPFESVHILSSGPKSVIPVDILIDDNPVVLEEVWKSGNKTHTVLLDQPWNRGINGNYVRVWDYASVLEEVEWLTTQQSKKKS